MTWHVWQAEKTTATCGGCGASIGAGEVYALTRSKLVRCEDCAVPMEVLCIGEDVCPFPRPARQIEQPTLTPPPPEAQPFASVRDLARRARVDFKQKQVAS